MSAEPRVSRPRPEWSWTNEWRWRGRTDVHGRRSIKVVAQFSFNENPMVRQPDGEGSTGVPLPNEIVLRYVHGQDSVEDTVRMDRPAARVLIEQLQAALDWDGS